LDLGTDAPRTGEFYRHRRARAYSPNLVVGAFREGRQ
jgi:hypothetical protein